MRSFEDDIVRMNRMYRLQVAERPTLKVLENRPDGTQVFVRASERLISFRRTLMDELKELDELIELAQSIETAPTRQSDPLDLLVGIADLCTDMNVFCTSEQVKFGLPSKQIAMVVMDSNFSKLQPDGSSRYDEHGKFLKGPNYWRPEPMIRKVIENLLAGQPVEMAD